MLLLTLMTESLEIRYKATGQLEPEGNLKVHQFMALPYLSDRRLAQLEDDHAQLVPPLTSHNKPHSAAGTTAPRVNTTNTAPTADPNQTLITRKPAAAAVRTSSSSPPRLPSPSRSIDAGSVRYGPLDSSTITVVATMPSELGLRSWRWYEATLEALAVGIYLYATFVLTSVQFLSGSTGLTYAAIMAICMSLVRILGSIF